MIQNEKKPEGRIKNHFQIGSGFFAFTAHCEWLDVK